MKASIKIQQMKIEAEVDSDDPQVMEACQKIMDNCGERVEAAVAETVTNELKRMLPGITVECTGVWD